LISPANRKFVSQKWVEVSYSEKKKKEDEEEENCVLQTNSKFLVHAGFLCDGCIAGTQ
jgi:hypothetical protein